MRELTIFKIHLHTLPYTPKWYELNRLVQIHNKAQKAQPV